jgi:hypothetical protein
MSAAKQDMVSKYRTWRASSRILEDVSKASKAAFELYSKCDDTGTICEWSEEAEEAYKIAANRYHAAQLDYNATKISFERAAATYCIAIAEEVKNERA